MASKLKGFDPDLGRRFAEENGGLVVRRPKVNAEQSLQDMPADLAPEGQRDWLQANGFLRRREEDMPRYGVDAQEQHDWLNASPQTVLEEDFPYVARLLRP